tara:strand:- start:7678 stop:7971 length:294 start_codon:yes stop_codon:yes gene_type:complete
MTDLRLLPLPGDKKRRLSTIKKRLKKLRLARRTLAQKLREASRLRARKKLEKRRVEHKEVMEGHRLRDRQRRGVDKKPSKDPISRRLMKRKVRTIDI